MTASGRRSSGSRSTASCAPPPSCSAAAATPSATSPTPTSARSAWACPARCPSSTERAVEFAMRIGAALHCDIRRSIFHRKNYFYPDMPKDYQISQYDEPINVDGWLELPDGTRVGIERAHMEEDTGKSTHVGTTGRIHGADHSLVDYNRAGVPLVEIVSRPDIRAPEQARAYVVGAARHPGRHRCVGRQDGGGQLRVDANVVVRRPGEPLGTRCEIKNLNSLRSLGRAIDYEASRQVDLLESGGTGRAGDPALERGRGPHVDDAVQGGGVRLPVLPRARPRPDRSIGGVEGGGARRPAPACRRNVAGTWPALGGVAPADVAVLVELDLDDLVTGAIEAGAEPRVAINRAANEVASAIGVGGDARPDRVRHRVPHGVGRAAHRHAGQAGAGRAAGGGRRSRGDRRAAGFQAGRGRADRVGRGPGHRRRRRRVGPLRRGRGQARRHVRRPGDEGDRRARPTARP